MPRDVGYEAVQIALRRRDEACVRALAKGSAAVNQEGSLPLVLACVHGSSAFARILLDAGADVKAACCDWTELHIMCVLGDAESVQQLVDGGAKVSKRTFHRETPLYVACKYDQAAWVLLQVGAKINKALELGLTPLFIACQEGHEACVRLLLEGGADLDERSEDGLRLVEEAEEAGFHGIVAAFGEEEEEAAS